ncbi:hypothetical protein ACWDYJ_30875 [Streptomyces sp. NPDC003042]
MSTPDEQQPQQPQQPQQDPYATQTWQSDTWDTTYQPVQPPLGAVPGQAVAPEGWFRDELPPQPPQPQPQEWAQAASWQDGAAAEQTAYLPPYPGPEPVRQQQSVAPEGWFRDEAPQAQAQAQAQVPAPSADWSQGTSWQQGAGTAAEQTAYLPPVREAAAEQTAYLPPVREAAAEQTAYLPPYPGPARAEPQQPQQPQQAQSVAPDGWFRDEPAQQAAQAAQPPQADGPWAVESTAYLPPQPAPAPEPAAEYSPPTLAGNTIRAVDPAQARAEGRSPIIDPGPQPAVLTAALGLLLAAAAAFGDFALLVPLIALQGLTAAGWFRLNGMWPARQGIVLAFAGAVVADGAVLAVDPTYGPGAIIGTLGAWVLLTLVLQLRSHADPDERMYGLMASVASAALAIVCAGYLAADSRAVSVGAAAVAVAVFTRALPLPTAASVGVSLAAAAGAGIAVGGLTTIGAGGALLGLAAGVCALIGLRVAAYDYPSKFVHMTAGVALPLAAAAPAVYLIGRVVG